MSDLFKPYDVAIFLAWADFKISKEDEVRKKIWKFRNLEKRYKENEELFNKEINKCLEQIENIEYFDEVEAINQVLADIGSDFTIDNKINEQTTVESYFRLIKLKIIYGESKQVRMKLRTFLKEFKYKRREATFINNVKNTLDTLEIITYVKNFEKCDIAKIKLDDMVIFRLC